MITSISLLCLIRHTFITLKNILTALHNFKCPYTLVLLQAIRLLPLGYVGVLLDRKYFSID